MRTFDFAPLYRSTVGFDRLFDLLDTATTARSDWPPYNIEKTGEHEYRITMAIAGFRPEEVELTQQGNTLLVAGKKAPDAEDHQMLHQGIAFRNFTQTFNVADYVKVAGATLRDGLLSVDLVREVPEQLKPRRIDIASTATPTAESHVKQIDQAKAA
ncbi:Hsp20 family protein [Starkeya sp. ORNL1]|uniref:Hsp20 family protein n=1 Tax=Starkeya sp. ORNL1 TaxID=2709380 RepID=UPI001463B1F2|nr:Hsp20 family protein [Starkeya sp. ORNL1]QJP17476.1 Hsp20 family protein [Starkeya sp. ORNL1]